MLNNFSNTVGLPVLRIDMSEEAAREQLHEMHNYLFQLQEWLDWKLRHLEVEDFSNNKDVLDLVYPVGSVYISVSDTPPGKLFGGEWERIKGRFLLATGDAYAAGQTGGEPEHTLTEAEMPQHEHRFPRPNWYAQDSLYGGQAVYTTYTWDHSDLHAEQACIGPAGVYAPVGGSLPHNNMPPYYVVNMWKRVR